MSSPELFLKVLDRACLDEASKAQLEAEATSSGITPELWSKLNGLLIEDLNQRKQTHDQATKQLDVEICRFTEEYEKEKTVLDRQMMVELKHHKTEPEVAKGLWADYRKKIDGLQKRITAEVQKNSHTILSQVVVTVGSAPWPH